MQSRFAWRIWPISLAWRRLRFIITVRALTAMSPLQYQKRIRLQTARARMLADDVDAATVAFEVGYESASQFNREYSRMFGEPPLRDVRKRRSSGDQMVESGAAV